MENNSENNTIYPTCLFKVKINLLNIIFEYFRNKKLFQLQNLFSYIILKFSKKKGVS